jgi:Ca-activated chloride channel family protein
MTFRAPMWLWLIAAGPIVLVFLLAREQRRASIARRFASERLRGISNRFRVMRPYFIALAVVATAVAIAGPQAGFHLVPILNRESNRVLAIDVSHSMGAEDVGASRLAAAKGIAKRIVENHDGRIGLVAFEGSADVISPLTNDSEAVMALLETLQTGEVGTPGSDLSAAVNTSLRLVDGEVNQKADLIVISDGEEQGGRLADALRRARTRGAIVNTILIGTTEGATIPMGDGVLRDESGEVVTTQASPTALARMARTTGGMFFENPFSEHALDQMIVRRVAGDGKHKPVRVPIDRYQWPLALAFTAFFCGSILNRGAD